MSSIILYMCLYLHWGLFKIISIFMYRTYFSYTFRGYNDHISINNLCFQINNFWMVLLDMTVITRIPCQSLVLSIFLDVTDLFVKKCCVACNKFYNALRGILYSLNNYTATNSSPSSHIKMGQNFVSCFWEQKFRNRAMWNTHWTFEHGYRILMNMWLDSLKCVAVEKRALFPTSTHILESIYVFWQNS